MRILTISQYTEEFLNAHLNVTEKNIHYALALLT